MPKLKAKVQFPHTDGKVSPLVAATAIEEYGQSIVDEIMGEVAQLRDPNVDKVRTDLDELQKLVAGAHKEAAEAREQVKILQAMRDMPRHKEDYRQFVGLTLRYDPARMKFDDGDNWQRESFIDDQDEKRNRSLKLFYNLLLSNIDDMPHLDEPSIKLLNRFRALNDLLVVEHAIRQGLLMRNPDALMNYQRRGGIRSLASYPEFKRIGQQLQLANAEADPNAGSGLEWDPTGVSTQLLPEVWPSLQVLNQIPTVPMGRSPMLYPVAPPHIEAFLLTEATDQAYANNNAIGPKNITTRNVTLTARKLGVIIWNSTEFEEDTIVPWAAQVRAGGAFGIETAKEDAAVNGQASAISGVYGTFPTSGQTTSTFDTGVTFLGNGGQEDPRRSWDGLRYAANQSGAVEDASTGLVVDNLSSIQAKIGRFAFPPEDTFFWTGYKGRGRLLTLRDAANTAVILRPVLGDAGSYRTGDVGRVFGVVDLATSYYQSDDLNASGIDIGGGGGRAIVGIANRKRYVIGTVRLTRVEVLRETRGDVDQIGVKFTHRAIMKRTVQPATTDVAEGAIVGIGV